MKKFTNLVLALSIIIALQNSVNAIQTNAVKEQTQINKNTAKQAQTITEEVANNSFDKKFETLTERYINNMRTCEPLHINQYWDIFGLKFGFKLDINGWNGDKCSYNLTGKFDSLGKDIRDVFEVSISDETISKFEPIVKCDFSKDELNILVDAIIARNKRNQDQINRILKNPDDLYSIAMKKEKLSPEEEKLIKVLVSGKACSIPNQQELMKTFTDMTNSL